MAEKKWKRRAMRISEREQFLELMRKGWSARASRDKLGIDGETYKRTCEENPEFKIAIADAGDRPHGRMIELLMVQAEAGDMDAQKFLATHFHKVKTDGRRLDIARLRYKLSEAIAKGELKGGGIDLLKLLAD